jgi:sulfotransferase
MNKKIATKTDQQKTYYFIAGMPRAGSTLLANVLAQNPRFHATATSGVMDMMFGVRNSWHNHLEFKANPDDAALLRVLHGILEGFYANIDKPVIFDKCRGWLSLIEMAEATLNQKVKVLVPVRDIRDILASFEKLWRENAKTSQSGAEAGNYFQFQNVEGRTENWLRGDQPVGLAYNRIRDAVARGYLDRMHFVHFEKMTSDPKASFDAIYEFLGEEPFKHNFDRVEQVTWEDDSVHGFKGLHDIRQKVAPIPPNWPKTLGSFAEQYGRMNFWNQY